MELSDNKLFFQDILMTKTGEKIWMYIYSKPLDCKHYISYLSDCPKPCLKNILCCLARRICIIVENKNSRHMMLKELRTFLKTQKYPEIVIIKIKKGIEKVLPISQEQHRTKKLKNNDDILPFLSTYNSNNSNVFPKARETSKHRRL